MGEVSDNGVGEAKTKDCSDAREDEAFGEQLTNQSAPNSLLRAAVRASNKFERLTQTISRISPTADQSTISDRRSFPLT